VKYRDVSIMLPVIVQVWLFVTPIVYPVDIVPERWRSIYSLNPLVGLIEGFRAVLLNRALNLNALLFSTVITIPLVIYALFVFRRMERDFADVV
jgi:lipopolysaccharide transport system permease protein